MPDTPNTDATADVAQPEVEDAAAETDADATSHDDTDADATKPLDGEFDAERAKRTIEAQRKAERDAIRRAKEAETKAAELEAKVKEFERKQMSDDERARAELEDLKAERDALKQANDAAQRERSDMLIRSALIAAFSKPEIGSQDAEAALKLADLSEIETDEDGKPTTESVQAIVAATMEAYPFLRVQRRASTGPAANPSRNQKPVETVEQRRARLAGDSGVSPFDSDWAQQHGGGVRQSN